MNQSHATIQNRTPSIAFREEVRKLPWPDSARPAQQPQWCEEIFLMISVTEGKETLNVGADEMRLSKLVAACLELNADEVDAIASVVGEGDEFHQSPAAFGSVLKQAIRSHRLDHLFCSGDGGEHHRGITPSAYNERTGEIYPEEMARWRADFRAMAPERQMIAATIIWLYQSGPDSTWLRRVPCTWRAAEALLYMRDAGCLSVWLRLIGSYPGW